MIVFLSLISFPELWSTYSEVMVRLLAALLLGMAVGFEREFRDKPAGLRTIILICVGACTFAMVSEAKSGATVDPTRIAAQIVTGVGFLGAGSILRSTKAVYGLTTAATIWMVAAIGIACGFGEYGIAFGSTFVILAVLVVFQTIVSRITRARNIQKYRIATQDPEVRFLDFESIFQEFHLRILKRKCYQDQDHYVFGFKARGHVQSHLALREKLLHMDRFELRRS